MQNQKQSLYVQYAPSFFSSKIVERSLLIVSEHMANSSCTNAHYMSPLQTKESGGVGILSLYSFP